MLPFIFVSFGKSCILVLFWLKLKLGVKIRGEVVKNTKKLTEGAILLAVFAVLLLITVYVPVIGMIVNLFLAVPFIIFAAKNDGKSIIVFMIAALFLSVIVGSILSLPLGLAYGTTGVVIGYLIQLRKGRIPILIVGSLVFLINLIIIYAVTTVIFNVNMIDEMFATMNESIQTSAELLKNFGNPEETEKAIEQMVKGIALLETLLPTLIVMASISVVFVIQLVSFPIIKRFGIEIKKWNSVKEISLPKSLLWYYLITLLLSMFLNPEEGTYVYTALLNLTYILQFFMIVQGYTFMFYFFSKKGMSKAVSITIAVVSFLIPIFLYIIAILGIIDLGFDLRNKL